MMNIVAKIMPIFLLFLLGYILYTKQLLKQETVDDLKRMIVNIALPATLFITFLKMEFQKEYIVVVVVMMIFMGVTYLAGVVINKVKRISHFLNPFLTTGFCFGLLGIPLAEIGFGVGSIGFISILGLANEVFVWTIYFMFIKIKFNKEKPSLKMAKGIVKSPLIISIILGIVLNIAGGLSYLEINPIWRGIYSTIEYLKSIATPLMLIIIGYGFKIDRRYLKTSIQLIIIRMGIIFSLGYLVKYVVINRIISGNPLFDAAYFTFLVLPPVYALPILVGEYGSVEQEELANNTIILGTIVSIVIYSIYVVFRGYYI